MTLNLTLQPLAIFTFSVALIAMPYGAWAQAKDTKSGAFGSFGNSKEPVKIDAGSLQVLDKEQKAIYKGDVVAVQGQTTLRCSTLTVFYMQQKDKTKAQKSDAQGGNAIKKLNCDGPVSVVSTTQTATGNYGVFDAENDIVTLTGNVVLADCENVQQGDKLVYNTKTGIANVTNNGSRRVQGVFTPSSQDKNEGKQAKQAGCKDKR
jgi:lipopolysaccharide export system protein LptA